MRKRAMTHLYTFGAKNDIRVGPLGTKCSINHLLSSVNDN